MNDDNSDLSRPTLAPAISARADESAAASADPVDVLGPLIRERRKALGLTLSAVSGSSGMSVGHLSQV
ncbi:MAG: XRE family transcriptional regulator, partial [Hyphomicrobiales bacterium]